MYFLLYYYLLLEKINLIDWLIEFDWLIDWDLSQGTERHLPDFIGGLVNLVLSFVIL